MSSIFDSILRPRVGFIAGAALLMASASSLEAQIIDSPRFGLGYVANAPEQMAGGSGYVILPVLGGLGLYVDAKFDIDSPSKDIAFREDLTGAILRTSEEFSGARFLNQEYSYKSVNIALVRPITSGVSLYAGLGRAWGDNYKLYEQLIGDLGYALWVVDPEFDETKTNLLGGMMLRISSLLTVQVGYETEPKGVTAGMSLRLPRW